jgi:hypothetical protein
VILDNVSMVGGVKPGITFEQTRRHFQLTLGGADTLTYVEANGVGTMTAGRGLCR